MASVSRIRHTVLRLIDVPSTVRTRVVTSARDCRLSGCLAAATWSNGGANGAPNADGAAPAVPPRCGTPTVVAPRAGPGRPVAATGTEPSFGRQSLQPAPRRSAGMQAGSSVRDHAWEASSGNTDRNGHQHASNCSLKVSLKTRTLILKRSTKPRHG